MAVTSKINGAIPQQAFELIRDQIGMILEAERLAQITHQKDEDTIELLQKTKIFKERFHPFNESEFFGVEVFLFNGDYDNKHQTSSRGSYTFYLDCVGRALTTNREDGDARSAIMLQRLIGIVRAILESPNWFQLGFTGSDQFVNRTEIRSIKRTEEKNNEDSGNIMFYRIVFDVIANENTDLISGTLLAESFTEVNVEETDLGFEYKFPQTP